MFRPPFSSWTHQQKHMIFLYHKWNTHHWIFYVECIHIYMYNIYLVAILSSYFYFVLILIIEPGYSSITNGILFIGYLMWNVYLYTCITYIWWQYHALTDILFHYLYMFLLCPFDYWTWLELCHTNRSSHHMIIRYLFNLYLFIYLFIHSVSV